MPYCPKVIIKNIQSYKRNKSLFYRNRRFCPCFLIVSSCSFSTFSWPENVTINNDHFCLNSQCREYFIVRKFIIVMRCFIFTLWIQQTCNRTNLTNLNFKRIVISVLISRVFHYVDFQRFGDLKTRFLHNDHFCINKKCSKYFVVLKFVIVMWCDVFNLICLIFQKWLQQTCNRTILPNPIVKGIVSFVLICWVFQSVHFNRVGALKTRILYVDLFA